MWFWSHSHVTVNNQWIESCWSVLKSLEVESTPQ